MSPEELEANLLALAVPAAMAEDLRLKFSQVPGYGLVEALADYPRLSDPEWGGVKDVIQKYVKHRR